MVWNVNNSSRQYAQQAQQHHQQQFHRFHRHNQQLADKQMKDLMAGWHARRANEREQAPGHHQPDGVSGQPEGGVPQFRRRSNARLVVSVLIVAMMLVVIAVAATAGYRTFSGGGPVLAEGGGGAAQGSAVAGSAPTSSDVAGSAPTSSDVAGSVLTGSNVRQGPGTSFGVVAVLASGSGVTVSCVDAGWARLASPYAGSYIFRGLLALKEDPKPCTAESAR
jgi:hypothetical protein